MLTTIVLIAFIMALVVLTVLRCHKSDSPNANLLVETHASIDWNGDNPLPKLAPYCLLPLPHCSLFHC